MTDHPLLSVPEQLDPALLEHLIAEHRTQALPRLEQLWDYYRNQASDAQAPHGRRRLAQEQGLPPRLTTGADPAVGPAFDTPQREIVIENDIAWRVHTLVDFMFGKPFALQSLAEDDALGNRIEAFLQAVFDQAGGIAFFQELALLGSVYGYVDVLLRLDEQHPLLRQPPAADAAFEAARLAQGLILETIEAPRALPLLDPADYRRLHAYVLNFHELTHDLEDDSFLARLQRHGPRGLLAGGIPVASQRAALECTQVWTASTYQSYLGPVEQRRPVETAPNRLGRIPIVHIQNLPQPFFYEGLSEIEPLIPLQDELNTRLSDRANRVTFQSFKMYLGKGIEGFNARPVGPGQMWSTDNLDATIQEFGGDSHNPSEDAHIDDIRQALDKASGVSPVAAGLLRNKVGNLTSENALRIVLMGLLAKTEKKRVTYGTGIARLCELILHAADVTGLLPNTPADRRVNLHWPSPLPENQTQRLQDALLKLDIGVPREQVLAELGYGRNTP